MSRRGFLRQAGLAGVAAGLGAGCGPLRERQHEIRGGDMEAEPEYLDLLEGGGPLSAMPSGRSNVVLVMLDTLRADKCSCYGYPQLTTPGLDALAASGVLFERAISQCSWTRPSVGSLLTSLHPRTLGLYREQGEALNSKFSTLGKMMQAAGYRTFGATANPNLNRLFNFHEGFDKYVDTHVVFQWMKEQAAGDAVRGMTPLPSAPVLFEEALTWAKAQPAAPDARHFMQLNVMEVHEWYAAPSYDMRRAPYNEMFRSGTQYDKWVAHADRRRRWHRYLQLARQVTDDLGDFVAKLSALPGWEDTLFVVVSDHGEGLESHPTVDRGLMHGFLLYESQVVVPLIFYNPAWTPAYARVQQPVRLLDVLPTILEYVGLPIPKEIEGRSLFDILTGRRESVELPEFFVAETAWYPKYEKLACYRPEWNTYDNYGGHPRLPRWELQRARGPEHGTRSDRSKQAPAQVQRAQKLLRVWELSHPKAPPTPVERDMTQEEIEQLEAIGYLGG